MDASPLERLRTIVARLRAPDGCPWDREQTHASLRTALLEETYEVLAAIEADDDPNLREELGDLLLHVVLHSQIASERGAFDFDAVAREIGEKMVRRHPHVFGGDRLADTAAVLVRWDEIKRREKEAAGRGGEGEPSQMDGLPAMLPALMRAQKAQEKAAKVGFDWRAAAEVLAKVREEVAEIEETAPGASRGRGRGDRRPAFRRRQPRALAQARRRDHPAPCDGQVRAAFPARRDRAAGTRAKHGTRRPTRNWTPCGTRPRQPQASSNKVGTSGRGSPKPGLDRT